MMLLMKSSCENKDNYLHFKLKNMSHITDPMMSLKQIYPNTLALTNETLITMKKIML